MGCCLGGLGCALDIELHIMELFVDLCIMIFNDHLSIQVGYIVVS